MTSLIQHFENPPLMAFDQTEIQGITNTQLDFESNQYGTCQVLETCGACWTMPESPLGDLMAYFEDVRAVMRQYLDQATDADLSRTYHHRGRDQSGTWIVGHILVEESQHTGQVAMIRGMMPALGV